jgi:predicted dienelactone hydrolase
MGIRKIVAQGAAAIAIATGWVALDGVTARSTFSAEYLQIGLGLFSISIPIEALETFAATGKSPEAVDRYLDYLPPEAREQFQEVLTREFEVSPVAVSQVTYSAIGEDFLMRLGKVVQTPSGLNGSQAIRAALILAAANPEGMSVLGILEAFPTTGIHIDGGELLDLQRELSSYFSYRDATLEAIREQMEREIAEGDAVDWASVPDLTQRGDMRFEQTTLELTNEFPNIAAASPRVFKVDLYIPQTVTISKLPFVVISHGLGSSREEFADMAEHLASYGFAVAVPEHPGSNIQYQQEFLANISYEGVDPFEFVYRPWDIKTLLNVLAADPTYARSLDLDDVGVIGHSFGGYTALALAGATLNLDRTKARCNPVEFILNLSTLLQCRAAELPPRDYNLADERVTAVMAYSPVTSVVLGPESLAEIDDPVMIIAGSGDFIAPAIPEQIHPFIWLETAQKYLATFVPASHVSINGDIDFPDQVDVAPQVSSLLTGPAPELSTDYAHALNVAFMGFYLSDRPRYEKFLGAAYAAEFLSEPPIALRVVSSLTAEQLREEYGGAPPIPIYPEPTPVEPEPGE